ncbi:hypothetical protein BCR33DRAFT_718635 [Rhizoclosmatium globosum]|uniref:Uncharacterized protein n=1 Tax=Rhizoclosmatium globosum TaxID=329046 RepID=A0A1Y2C4R3_9FUNG|nr:hypothetical protein BCR33DRAFT_718635 [Rhizoclosmatium globosum]|eukprot:ORY42001.1 hypothetical protein BCR33DRAFT_718635 [Rhizoclosmatium globosum]
MMYVASSCIQAFTEWKSDCARNRQQRSIVSFEGLFFAHFDTHAKVELSLQSSQNLPNAWMTVLCWMSNTSGRFGGVRKGSREIREWQKSSVTAQHNQYNQHIIIK